MTGRADKGADKPRDFPMGFREFLAMMASLMALNALAIDAMLPAFPAIGAALGIVDANDRQYVLSAYLFGSAIGALFYGSLADRYGRKPVLLSALLAYAIFAALGGFSTSFPALLGFRFAQGLAAAAMGVVALAVIRDRYSGDRMARLVSLVFIVFMAVPIIAPTLGQMILYVASWRFIFILFVVLSGMVALWVWQRLPETLDPANVIPIRTHEVASTWREVVTNRGALGYVLASGIVMGGLFGYLNSAQQIFADIFDAADIFPYAFAAVAASIAVSNWFNSRIVEKFGARRVSHSALIAFIILSGAQIAAASMAHETLPIFLVLIAANMSMIGFTGSNFGSIAMQPFGRMAGAASSFQQFARTLLAAAIGAVIGQMFDGSVVPMATGFLITGLVALVLVAWSENWQLFKRRTPPGTPAMPD
ncbi:MAG: multidrug effflux MFS transporter [Sphingomonadales bacterium]|nr:multidrug effflux MFS transporter [Sphingomonadales bacterium]